MPFLSIKWEKKMRKILAVIKREYLQIVRTKGFIIGTILGPVLMILLLVVPVMMSVVSVEQQEKIGIIDSSGEVFEGLNNKLADFTLKDGSRRYLLEEFSIRGNMAELKEDLNQKVLAKELSAYIFIHEDIIQKGEAEFVSEHVSDFNKNISIRNALNNVIVQIRLKGEDLDPERIGRLLTPVNLVTKKGWDILDILLSCSHPLYDPHFLWASHIERCHRRKEFACGRSHSFFLKAISAYGWQDYRHCRCRPHSVCDLDDFRISVGDFSGIDCQRLFPSGRRI
jgi:hypothetical protein